MSLSPRAHAVLIARQIPGHGDVHAGLDELENLLEALGIRVAHRVVQRCRTASAGIGEGKQEEVAALLAELRDQVGDDDVLVVVDSALGSGPQRALGRALGVEVVDRPWVILQTFERHAQTRVARIELELARLHYEAPRVREDASLGGREGGGGRGERGHTNVELKKQEIRARIGVLRRELAGLRQAEATQRARRSEALRAALVGYTNAGKSSLMRALTGSEVLVEDRLFATLDTTVRALSPEAAPRILVSDTVGFIRDLPHELVASFHATLAEAREAGLLLLVVDASDPQWREQLRVAREAIVAVGAGEVPTRIILNKIDRVDAATRAALADELPSALQISALSPADARRLRAAIVEFFDAEMIDGALVVPFTEGHLLGEIRAQARVIEERHDGIGTLLRVRARPEALARWQGALASPIETADALLTAARRHGLQLPEQEAAFDASGLDFLVVHARDEDGAPWILRTPRRPEVFEATRVEARVLRLVRPRLPVAVPDWRVHARELIAYPRIAGTPAVTLTADGPSWNHIDPEALPEAFLDSFARALAAMQAIAPEVAASAGVPVRSLAQEREELARTMAETREALAPSEAVWQRWQRWLDDEAIWPKHLALVHRDLHPGHMLLGTDGSLVGILDWTEARVADPSIDLAMFHGAFKSAGLVELVARFERAGGRTWPGIVAHAAERWAAFPAAIAAWAAATNNAAVLEHARALLAAVTAESEALMDA